MQMDGIDPNRLEEIKLKVAPELEKFLNLYQSSNRNRDYVQFKMELVFIFTHQHIYKFLKRHLTLL
jgi:hypothetical protein